MTALPKTISSLLIEFEAEIDSLTQLDNDNQRNFSSVSSGATGLSRRQLHIITEALLFAAFRSYETFILDIFRLYCLEEKPRSGFSVFSYLKPRDIDHAGDLIKSGMPFLDWGSPDAMILRAELYLEQGFPIKLAYTANKETLGDLKKIRNHIAHNSKESLSGFQKVLQKHYGVLPLVTPSAGEFLLATDNNNPTTYKLQTYLAFLKKIAGDLT